MKLNLLIQHRLFGAGRRSRGFGWCRRPGTTRRRCTRLTAGSPGSGGHTAQTVTPTTVRSLDAIHLATALHSRPSLTSFVTYDKRLLDAAQAAGLPTDSPA